MHQPYRLGNYSVFDIGNNKDYFNETKNKQILKKVATKCYIPTNNILLQLLHKHPKFKISFSFSGVVLEQFEKYAPEVIESFKQLVDTGRVEILEETYYHSLAFIYSKKEFREQVRLHNKKIRQVFGVNPTIFRNTELIYNNELAQEIASMGYKGIIAEGADKILGWKSPNFIYKSSSAEIPILLKNYKLSDDIAFRFSNKEWEEHPLSIGKYSQWINAVNGNGNVINLFMDYETFGEHQWASTGIFNFLKSLPEEVLKHPDNNFMTPSEVISNYSSVGELDVPYLMSWADIERDVSAWLGNKMQQSSASKIYEIEDNIKLIGDKKLLEDWRKLQTSDHFYYMCTKWFNDGDVHKYFNPHDSPYDAFITYMNIFNDLNSRMKSV